MIELTNIFIFWQSGVPNEKVHTHELERLTILWVYTMFLGVFSYLKYPSMEIIIFK